MGDPLSLLTSSSSSSKGHAFHQKELAVEERRGRWEGFAEQETAAGSSIRQQSQPCLPATGSIRAQPPATVAAVAAADDG